MRFYVRLVCLWFCLALIACGQGEEGSAVDEVSADTSLTPTINAIAIPTLTPVPTTIPEAPDNTLTVWTVPQFAPSADTAGGAVLQAQLDEFAAQNPDIELIIETKAIDGDASILSYLRAGRTIAPDILPDLIMLPSGQLQTAVSEALIYPLNDLIPESRLNALYPSAKSLSQNNANIVGYPFAFKNVQHMAYKTDAFPEEFPTTWNEYFRDSEESLIFPANGKEGTDLILQLYLDEGGRLTDNSGNPVLDQTPLTTTLGLFEFGLGQGNIAFASDRAVTSKDAWDVFTSSSPAVILTTANQFLQQRQLNPNLGYALTMGNNNTLTSLVEGWVWAISTDDETKQEQASDLLTWLTTNNNLGEWTQSAQIIPASESVLTQWPEDDPYTAFLSDLLPQTIPHPLTESNQITSALNQAVLSVIAQTSSAPSAAQTATGSIR